INIHGQHDNQALLDPSRHVRFLDAYARTETELAEYKGHYSRAREISARLKMLTADDQEKLRRADLLSYQINEINAAALADGEEEELAAQRKLLENAETIGENTEKAYAALYDYPDGQSAYDLISGAVDATEQLAEISPELTAAHEAIQSAMYAIEDAAREIREFGENADYDPQALEDTLERLDLINRLKRKYGGSIKEINEFRDRAQRELDDIATSDEQAEKLRAELDEVKAQLKKAAAALTKKRAAAAKTLEKEIERALHELNMEKASFAVKVEPERYTPNGADAVEFLIATNPGEPQKPLVKIASGGELSRVMLAIKSILAEADGVETLIFDEIDTGVSGSAAQKIADKLKAIGRHKQVICITHLPQLAGAADNHYLIEKDTDGELARTTLTELDREGRIHELARIVGGGKAGEDYARSVIK
ncbi:MAG: DNA repair protein RecN, partial [Clostridia bacterium]|nr:DNA repair protein RecN [Clostridia bacterium]